MTMTHLKSLKVYTIQILYITLTPAFFWLLEMKLRGNEEIYTDLKKFTQTWFVGSIIFPGLA